MTTVPDFTIKSDYRGDTGVPPSGSGCQPSASAAEEASSQSGIPNAGGDPLFAAMQDEFNRVAGTDNWRMHDTPKLSPEYFDKLLGIFGDGNYRLMVGSQGNFRIRDGKSEMGEPWVRATLLLSPEAVENAQRYASAIEAAEADKTAQTGLAEGESAVPKADAQGPST